MTGNRSEQIITQMISVYATSFRRLAQVRATINYVLYIFCLKFCIKTSLFFLILIETIEAAKLTICHFLSLGYCLMMAHGFLAVRARLHKIKSHLLALYFVFLMVLLVRTYNRNQVWLSRHSLFW